MYRFIHFTYPCSVKALPHSTRVIILFLLFFLFQFRFSSFQSYLFCEIDQLQFIFYLIIYSLCVLFNVLHVSSENIVSSSINLLFTAAGIFGSKRPVEPISPRVRVRVIDIYKGQMYFLNNHNLLNYSTDLKMVQFLTNVINVVIILGSFWIFFLENNIIIHMYALS